MFATVGAGKSEFVVDAVLCLLAAAQSTGNSRRFIAIIVAPLVAPLIELWRKFKSLIKVQPRQGAPHNHNDDDDGDNEEDDDDDEMESDEQEEESSLMWSRSLVLYSSDNARTRIDANGDAPLVLFTTVHSLSKFDDLLRDANCVVMDEIATSMSLVFGGATLDKPGGERFRALSALLNALRLAPHVFAMDRDVTLVAQLFLALKPYLIKHATGPIPPIRYVWYKLLDPRRITYEIWTQKELEADVVRLVSDKRTVFWAQMSKRQAESTDVNMRGSLGVRDDDKWTVRTLTGDSEASAKEAMYRNPDKMLRKHAIGVFNVTPTFGLGASINESLVDGKLQRVCSPTFTILSSFFAPRNQSCASATTAAYHCKRVCMPKNAFDRFADSRLISVRFVSCSASEPMSSYLRRCDAIQCRRWPTHCGRSTKSCARMRSSTYRQTARTSARRCA